MAGIAPGMGILQRLGIPVEAVAQTQAAIQAPCGVGHPSDVAASTRDESCDGRFSRGCQVPLYVEATIPTLAAGPFPFDILYDPLQGMIPTALIAGAGADAGIRFQFVGPNGKTTEPEGRNLSDVFELDDFDLESLRSGLNFMPKTGRINQERPLIIRIPVGLVAEQLFAAFVIAYVA